MADRASFVDEWTTPTDVATATTEVSQTLASLGGKVEGDDPTAASFGSAFGYRMLGAYLPGAEDRMPLKIVVDVRPGDTPEETHIRAELRREDGGYLFRVGFLEDKAAGLFSDRFLEITKALRAATAPRS